MFVFQRDIVMSADPKRDSIPVRAEDSDSGKQNQKNPIKMSIP